jgi:hypothetical protein
MWSLVLEGRPGKYVKMGDFMMAVVLQLPMVNSAFV